MIDTSLVFIRDQLASFFANDLQDTTTDIELGNIAFFETNQSDSIENKVIISLVNTEEESTLKNGKTFERQPNGAIRHIRRPVNLNLYILFCCNFGGGEQRYQDSLRRLSRIILFFQLQNSYEVPDLEGAFKLNFELYTLTFEQINHLWGALGGRQLPSVMYKARLISIREQDVFRVGPPVEEIQGFLQGKGQ
ncbi:MAG: DUF4255 domain-containing protein [Saprospiraceae bacterium]|nr:DUF4255 domain-containing protein [Saprospiraceae bacterium]